MCHLPRSHFIQQINKEKLIDLTFIAITVSLGGSLSRTKLFEPEGETRVKLTLSGRAPDVAMLTLDIISEIMTN